MYVLRWRVEFWSPRVSFSWASAEPVEQPAANLRWGWGSGVPKSLCFLILYSLVSLHVCGMHEYG